MVNNLSDFICNQILTRNYNVNDEINMKLERFEHTQSGIYFYQNGDCNVDK